MDVGIKKINVLPVFRCSWSNMIPFFFSFFTCIFFLFNKKNTAFSKYLLYYFCLLYYTYPIYITICYLYTYNNNIII